MVTKIETLQKAHIVEVMEQRPHFAVGVPLFCMFNPFEYSISKSNTFQEKSSANGKNKPEVEFSKAGGQTLTLSLVFDTYEAGGDVRSSTDRLWKFMAVKPKPGQQKASPPMVAFHWGTFYFVAYITQMTQKFTLFSERGIPVRANVSITFTQYIDEDDYPPQNPSSGGGELDRVWRIIASDRLDNIAYEVYRDATKWRLIAEFNQVDDPWNLRPGQQLQIPLDFA